MREELVQKSMKVTNMQLRQSNSLLRKNLKRVVSCSHDNERAQERMYMMENIVFESGTAKSMFDAIMIQGRRIFDINVITVVLEPELEELYPPAYKDGERSVYLEAENVSFDRMDGLEGHFTDPAEPVLRGRMRRGTERFFAADKRDRVKSEAIVPLHNGERLVGVLAFGSQYPTRFLEGYGSRFVKRLSRIVTLKVELFRAQGPKSEPEQSGH